MSEQILPRILMVDDDDHLRRSMARALRAHFVIVEASDGDEAIGMLKAGERFDAVVTDLAMKRVGGDGFVAWLEVHAPLLARRVIVFTGGATSPRHASWLAAFDPMRVVEKLCSVPLLVGAIRRVLQEEK